MDFFIIHHKAKRVLTIMAAKTLPADKKAIMEETDKGYSLNFKVTPQFKKEFKGYAVSRGITMVDLLKEGFVLSKKQRSQ